MPHPVSTNPLAAMLGNATSKQRFCIDNVTHFIDQTQAASKTRRSLGENRHGAYRFKDTDDLEGIDHRQVVNDHPTMMGERDGQRVPTTRAGGVS
jgi:hypothetical protein